MHVHRSIQISAPPERVWPFLVDPEKVRKWYPTLNEFRYLDETRRGPGARVHMEERAPGSLLRCDFEATQWVENRCLTYHMTKGSGVAGYDQSWSIEPTSTGCEFTFDELVELPYGPLGKVLGAIGRRSSEAHVKEMLAQLKSLAEG